MKIAVTSTGTSLDDAVEARFGRCMYFLIIDTDSMQFEAIENPNISLGGGAGIQSAQLLAEKGVATVLTGNCGPNAFSVFGQTGIEVIVGVSGTARDAVAQLKNGAFSSASEPNVGSHFGTTTPQSGAAAAPPPAGGGSGGAAAASGLGFAMGGKGGGMGMGMGMGRGGGGGRGRGMGRGMGLGYGMPPVAGPVSPSSGDAAPAAPEQDLAALQAQLQQLEQQKELINQRIEQFHGGNRVVAQVDTEKCTACGVCERVCPVGAIQIDGHAVIDQNTCTGCAACVAHCPENALVITQKKNA